MKTKGVSTKVIKLVTFTICLLFTVGLIGSGVHYYREYDQTQQKLLPQRMRVQELQQDIEELDVFLKQYARDISRFEKMLFEDQDIPLFIEGISSSSERFNTNIIEIKALSPQIVDIQGARIRQSRRRPSARKKQSSPQDSLTLGSSPFRIKTSGTFGNIVQFLLSLQKHRQLLSVSNVVIKEKEYPLLECSFDLDLYSLIKTGQKEVQP